MHRHLDPAICYMQDFPEIYAPAMRLAKKYGAQQLLDMFAHSLRQQWPSSWKRNSALLQSRMAMQECLMDEKTPSHNVDYDLFVKPDPGRLARTAKDAQHAIDCQL